MSLQHSACGTRISAGADCADTWHSGASDNFAQPSRGKSAGPQSRNSWLGHDPELSLPDSTPASGVLRAAYCNGSAMSKEVFAKVDNGPWLLTSKWPARQNKRKSWVVADITALQPSSKERSVFVDRGSGAHLT
jgi:hypothetical protein